MTQEIPTSVTVTCQGDAEVSQDPGLGFKGSRVQGLRVPFLGFLILGIFRYHEGEKYGQRAPCNPHRFAA